MSINSYRDLKVWQKAMGLAKQVYTMVEMFPEKEKYRLSDQLCRAAISIPSNIAEGSARRSTGEFLRFVRISLGSLAELETQMTLAEELAYVSKPHITEVIALAGETGKMLSALEKALKEKMNHSSLATKLQTLDS